MGQSSIEGGSVHTLTDMVVMVGGLSTDCVMMHTCTTCTCTGHVKVQSAVTVCCVQSLLTVHEQWWRKLEPKDQQYSHDNLGLAMKP